MLGKRTVCILGVVLIIMLFFTSCADPYSQAHYIDNRAGERRLISSSSIKDLLSKDDKFVFVTSRTEPGESTKAYLFSTKMSVPEAAEYIAEKRKPFEASDMSSSEKIILTYDDEHVLIYQVKNKENKKETMVQASTRQYVYRSRHRGLFNPYMPSVFIPYPVYYERSLLNRDRERYRGFSSTKRSVRTGSVGSKFNRGGGTGFGK